MLMAVALQELLAQGVEVLPGDAALCEGQQAHQPQHRMHVLLIAHELLHHTQQSHVMHLPSCQPATGNLPCHAKSILYLSETQDLPLRTPEHNLFCSGWSLMKVADQVHAQLHGRPCGAGGDTGGSCSQKQPTSMASAAASALWPSSMDCSAPTRLRKAGALMTLFTDSARPMWRCMVGRAFSWDANSFSSVRLLSAACASPHHGCLVTVRHSEFPPESPLGGGEVQH